MGVFPVSISCMGLKEEAFLKDVDMISNLKLRVGYVLPVIKMLLALIIHCH